jgi:hypothetical protein
MWPTIGGKIGFSTSGCAIGTRYLHMTPEIEQHLATMEASIMNA